MYFRQTPTGFEEVRLEVGDRLVLEWRRRLFRAVKRLPGPEWVRTTSLQDFVRGFFQPRWQRLWMQNLSGGYVKGLPLPRDLTRDCVKENDPFLFLPQEYGLASVGGPALQWAWDEEADFGRDFFDQTSFVCQRRGAQTPRDPPT